MGELDTISGREAHRSRPVKVTVSDPDTGAVLEEAIVANDYVLITAGDRYLKSIQVMGRTHMLAVACRPREVDVG